MIFFSIRFNVWKFHESFNWKRRAFNFFFYFLCGYFSILTNDYVYLPHFDYSYLTFQFLRCLSLSCQVFIFSLFDLHFLFFSFFSFFSLYFVCILLFFCSFARLVHLKIQYQFDSTIMCFTENGHMIAHFQLSKYPCWDSIANSNFRYMSMQAKK